MKYILIIIIILSGCNVIKNNLQPKSQDSILIGYKLIIKYHLDGVSYSNVFDKKYKSLIDESDKSFIESEYFFNQSDVIKKAIEQNQINRTPIKIELIKLPYPMTLQSYKKWKYAESIN